MESLPYEVLLEVVGWAAALDKTTAFSLTLTSRSVRRAALPAVYAHVYLRSGARVKSFVSAVKARPSLAAHVRQLSLEDASLASTSAWSCGVGPFDCDDHTSWMDLCAMITQLTKAGTLRSLALSTTAIMRLYTDRHTRCPRRGDFKPGTGPNLPAAHAFGNARLLVDDLVISGCDEQQHLVMKNFHPRSTLTIYGDECVWSSEIVWSTLRAFRDNEEGPEQAQCTDHATPDPEAYENRVDAPQSKSGCSEVELRLVVGSVMDPPRLVRKASELVLRRAGEDAPFSSVILKIRDVDDRAAWAQEAVDRVKDYAGQVPIEIRRWHVHGGRLVQYAAERMDWSNGVCFETVMDDTESIIEGRLPTSSWGPHQLSWCGISQCNPELGSDPYNVRHWAPTTASRNSPNHPFTSLDSCYPRDWHRFNFMS